MFHFTLETPFLVFNFDSPPEALLGVMPSDSLNYPKQTYSSECFSCLILFIATLACWTAPLIPFLEAFRTLLTFTAAILPFDFVEWSYCLHLLMVLLSRSSIVFISLCQSHFADWNCNYQHLLRCFEVDCLQMELAGVDRLGHLVDFMIGCKNL